jgi:hypothetical protein
MYKTVKSFDFFDAIIEKMLYTYKDESFANEKAIEILEKNLSITVTLMLFSDDNKPPHHY